MKRFLLNTISLLPWVLLAQPEPGELFREYTWEKPAATETDFLRVGGPADYRINPANLPAAAQTDGYLRWPTPLDLEDVDRAELVLETFLFQPGATDLAVQWNEGEWQPVPDAAAIPVPRYERPQLYNAVVPIEVKNLVDTSNTFRLRVTEGPAELQAQYLIHGVMLRLYYKPRRKGGVRGEILLPHAGEALREDVQLVADLQGGATRIEYLAKYRDINWAGDGTERRWQYFFHQGEIRNVVATTENLLKSEFWDTRWLPDQEEPIELAARVHGADGLIYFTEAITDLRLERDFSVAIVFPTGQPPRWDTRYGRFTAILDLPGQPDRATAARLYWASWSPCYSEGVYLNGVEVYQGENEPCHQYVQHEIALPPVILRAGPNQLVTARTSSRENEPAAGMKVLYPGPTLKVRYGEPASPPKELFQRAPERIFYTVIDTVVSENFPLQLEEIAADEPQPAPAPAGSLPGEPTPVAPADGLASRQVITGDPQQPTTAGTTPPSEEPAATPQVRPSAPEYSRLAAPRSQPAPTDYVAEVPDPRPANTQAAKPTPPTREAASPLRSEVDTLTGPMEDIAVAPPASSARSGVPGRPALPSGTSREPRPVSGEPLPGARSSRATPAPAFSAPGSPSVSSRTPDVPPAVATRSARSSARPERMARDRRNRGARAVVPSQGSAHSQRSYAGLYVTEGQRSPFRQAMLLGDAVWQDYEVELNAKLLTPPAGSWLTGADPLPYFALATHLSDDPSLAPGDSLGAMAEFYVLPELESYLWRIVRDRQVLAEKMSNYPALELGQDYQVKFRAEAKGSETLYRVKCWPAGSPEPTDWDLQARDAGPANIGGYALLLPEEQSISFASVEVNPVVSEVRIAAAEDEGQAAFRIETPGATYLYQAAAGGFSSILDRNGNDWVDFHTTDEPAYPAAAANAYRGLPNLVFGGTNDGAGHPGFEQCTSVQIDESRIRTTTLDGRWQWTWTFFDYYAELEVERLDPEQGYWFLYEGPPAGRWDPAAAFWYTDQGEMPTDSLPDYYTGGGRVDQFRWAAFGQSYYDQIFYIAQRRPDELPDLGGYLGSTPAGLEAPDGMVVFGFGRGPQADPQLRRPERFVIGFTDLLPYAKVRRVIEGRLR